MALCCTLLFVILFLELRKDRTENQSDHQNHTWSQTAQRSQQGNQGDPPPAKRLKPSPETQQQLATLPTGAATLTSLLNSSIKPTPLPSSLPTIPQNTSCNLSGQSVSPVSASRSQLPSAPFSHLQARIGGVGGSTRWSLRQTLGQRSLARRILGKERLAVHLRQRVLSDRGEETELLTYQDNADDLQVKCPLPLPIHETSEKEAEDSIITDTV